MLIACHMANTTYAQGNPDYNKWIIKGFDLYSAGEYKAAADAYTKAFRAAPAVPEDRYSAACAWARAGMPDSALRHLQHLANRDNFTGIRQLQSDSDLVSLHTDTRWATLLAQVGRNSQSATDAFNKSLSLRLDSMYNRDQAPRRELEATIEKFGPTSSSAKMAAAKIKRSDSVNIREVAAIIDQYGWPGPAMVGDDGSAAAFLVMQHADLKTQDKYLPLMRKAVKDGKAQASDLAILEDRVALGHGRRQTYGTQVGTGTNGKFVFPLADPDHVDERRARMGLGTIADYLQSFGLTWNPEEYKKQLPELEKQAKTTQ